MYYAVSFLADLLARTCVRTIIRKPVSTTTNPLRTDILTVAAFHRCMGLNQTISIVGTSLLFQFTLHPSH